LPAGFFVYRKSCEWHAACLDKVVEGADFFIDKLKKINNILATKKEKLICHRKGKTRVTGWHKATCPLIKMWKEGLSKWQAQ